MQSKQTKRTSKFVPPQKQIRTQELCYKVTQSFVTRALYDIDAKSPAFGWRLQLSDSISSSPAEQAKSPAELGLTNFVIHISYNIIVPQT